MQGFPKIHWRLKKLEPTSTQVFGSVLVVCRARSRGAGRPRLGICVIGVKSNIARCRIISRVVGFAHGRLLVGHGGGKCIVFQ
jgi:hypothetical protein